MHEFCSASGRLKGTWPTKARNKRALCVAIATVAGSEDAAAAAAVEECEEGSGKGRGFSALIAACHATSICGEVMALRSMVRSTSPWVTPASRCQLAAEPEAEPEPELEPEDGDGDGPESPKESTSNSTYPRGSSADRKSWPNNSTCRRSRL